MISSNMFSSQSPIAALLAAASNPFSRSEMLVAIIVVLVVLMLFSFIILLTKQYKRCPSNKVLVIYGKSGSGHEAAKCIHGGAEVHRSAHPRLCLARDSSRCRSRFRFAVRCRWKTSA